MKPKLVPLQIAKKTPGISAPRKEKDPFLDNEAQSLSKGEVQSNLGANRKIMVVDDNPIVLKAFELKLKANGFQVVTTSDGSAVVGTAGQQNPDLIILDVNFPPGHGTGGAQWSGLSIVQWLGRFKELAAIPVIIITGEDPERHKDKLMAAGAVAFFQKPVDFGKLLAAILQALGAPPRQLPQK